MPEEDFNLGRFFTAFKPVAYIDYSEIKTNKKIQPPIPEKIHFKAGELKRRVDSETTIEINRFKSWMQQKRYSNNTIKTYIHQLEIFFGYYN